MAVGYPSATDNFLISHAASKSLVVGFSRNPSTFRVADYAQYVMAGKPRGAYFVWASRQAARIISADGAEFNWADGAAAPTGNDNLEGGSWATFTTVRKAHAFHMGQIATEAADFPILVMESSVMAQQAMTLRTMLVLYAMINASWGNNTAVVDNGTGSGTILPAGNNWKTGSTGIVVSGTGTGAGSGTATQGPNILLTLQYGTIQIHKATIGVVPPGSMTLVINPTTAQAIAASAEIRDFVKQMAGSLAYLQGDTPNANMMWGLPPRLYGYKLAVEDAVRVTSQKGAAADAISYVLPDGAAFFVARQGDIEGFEGSKSFSTVQVFFYQDELTVESKYDADNRRYMGRVVTNYVPVLVSPYSGFYFTRCLG